LIIPNLNKRNRNEKDTPVSHSGPDRLFIDGANLADLFENNKQCVVTIYFNEMVNTGTGDPRTFASNMGLGSGVLIREDIVIDSEKSIFQIFDYLNQVESIATHLIRVLRAGEIIELKWVSSDFQSTRQ
jgi:hypothetical protein